MTTYVFRPPLVNDVSPILGDGSPGDALFKYFAPGTRGVNVYQLKDGTYVQDTPTSENENSSVPYPIGSAGDLVNTRWDPFLLQTVNITVANPVVRTYYGGHSYTISSADAAALSAAGYEDCIVSS